MEETFYGTQETIFVEITATKHCPMVNFREYQNWLSRASLLKFSRPAGMVHHRLFHAAVYCRLCSASE